MKITIKNYKDNLLTLHYKGDDKSDLTKSLDTVLIKPGTNDFVMSEKELSQIKSTLEFYEKHDVISFNIEDDSAVDKDNYIDCDDKEKLLDFAGELGLDVDKRKAVSSIKEIIMSELEG